MSLNTLRVKAAWLFVVPFLLFSHPTAGALKLGAPLALAGLAVEVHPGPRGIARGIAADGSLLVEDDRGRIHEIRSGSVTTVTP